MLTATHNLEKVVGLIMLVGRPTIFPHFVKLRNTFNQGYPWSEELCFFSLLHFLLKATSSNVLSDFFPCVRY